MKLTSSSAFRHHPRDVTDSYIDDADNVSLQRIDEADAVPMPDTVTAPWLGLEYDKYSDEQPLLYDGVGEEAARPYLATARSLDIAAAGVQQQLDLQRQKLDAAVAYVLLLQSALHRYVRREPGAKVWYLVRWALLLLGDIAGIAGAAILRGEIVSLALLQATSAATAAVTSGLIGQDIRDLVLARRRQKDPTSLSGVERPFAHLLQGSDAGTANVKRMVLVSGTIGLFIAGGICSLRTSVDGLDAGITFGCIAAAVCLASAINSYIYADEIADLIDSARVVETKARKQLNKLAKSPVVRRRGEADALAISIKAEHRSLGLAAATKFQALKYRAYRQNPAVLGHGPTTPTTNVVKLKRFDSSISNGKGGR